MVSATPPIPEPKMTESPNIIAGSHHFKPKSISIEHPSMMPNFLSTIKQNTMSAKVSGTRAGHSVEYATLQIPSCDDEHESADGKVTLHQLKSQKEAIMNKLISERNELR